MSCFEEFKHSSSCILKCNSFYLIFWGGVMSLLTISIHVSRFTCCQEWGILNPSFSSLELSCVRFHLKLFLKGCCYLWWLCMTQAWSLSSWWKKFSSLWCSQSNQWFPLVAGCHLMFLRCFSISPLQAYSFCCWFCNNSVITFLEGCFPSSFVAEVAIFYSILLFQWYIFYSFFRRHCDVVLFTHHLVLSRLCSFPCLST